MDQHEAKCWGYKEEKILVLSSLRAGKIFIFLGFSALNTKHRTSFKNNKKPTQSSMNQGFCLIYFCACEILLEKNSKSHNPMGKADR